MFFFYFVEIIVLLFRNESTRWQCEPDLYVFVVLKKYI